MRIKLFQCQFAALVFKLLHLGLRVSLRLHHVDLLGLLDSLVFSLQPLDLLHDGLLRLLHLLLQRLVLLHQRGLFWIGAVFGFFLRLPDFRRQQCLKPLRHLVSPHKVHVVEKNVTDKRRGGRHLAHDFNQGFAGFFALRGEIRPGLNVNVVFADGQVVEAILSVNPRLCATARFLR